MSRQPWTIRPDATMAEAHTMMRRHQIRHLPVLEGGKLIGLVTERDLHLIEALPGSDPEQLTVEEAMVSDVYIVTADDTVDKVVERMAAQKFGCAVVVGHRDQVEGIFTTIDALQVLADVLRRAAS